MDHIVALASGGQHTTANVQLLCARCNSLKSDKPMVMLMRRLWEETDQADQFHQWLLNRVMFDVHEMMA